MPSARGPVWSAMGDTAPQPRLTSPSAPDPFRELGDAAVLSASLSAGGGPGTVATSASVSATERPSAPWNTHQDGHQPSNAATPPTDLPEIANDAPAYAPSFRTAVPVAGEPAGLGFAGHPAVEGGGGEGTSDPAPVKDPWWRSTVFLIIVGLLVMGGLGFAAWMLFGPEDDTVALTPEVLVEPAAEATIEPITIDNPTDFQAAMPSTVGAFSMTGIAAPNVADAGLSARAAEIADLTYSDGSTDLTVRAIQHYNEADATAQFEALAADGTDRQPVEVGDAQVGERATVAVDGGEQIVWRNGTTVLTLTGPADEAEQFYALFPF